MLIVSTDGRHIIQELQKENATAANHNKLLESENKMLLSETDQLREVCLHSSPLESGLIRMDHK